jgi:hypothetical protein
VAQTQAYVITTLLEPATSTALLTLEDIKEELSIPDSSTADDDWYQNKVIPQVSRQIQLYCNRQFGIVKLQDEFRADQGWRYGAIVRSFQNPLRTSRWPVNRIESITETLLTTSTVLTEGIDFEVDYDDGELYRLNSTYREPRDWPADKVVVVYYSGYLLPGDTPPDDMDIDPLPDDISQAAIRLATNRIKNRGRDPMLMEFDQPQIGRKRYWVGTPPMRGNMPEELASILDNYRTAVVA